MKTSLRDIIKNYLRLEYPKAVHKGVIDKLAVTEWGYESESVGRVCRKMVKAGELARVENDKGHVMYRYVNKEKEQFDVRPKEVQPFVPIKMPVRTSNPYQYG